MVSNFLIFFRQSRIAAPLSISAGSSPHYTPLNEPPNNRPKFLHQFQSYNLYESEPVTAKGERYSFQSHYFS